ncbi:MAG TPA: alanine racemase, partial [Phycicoccus sp.]
MSMAPVAVRPAGPLPSPAPPVVTPGPAPVPTPRLELSVGTAVSRFLDLASALPGTAVHYAVKANPHPVLLRALAQAGCRFDVASPDEARAALAVGAPAAHLLHSNPVARRDHLVEAHELGVRLFVVDSAGEVAKVADAAPGSSVLVRIVTSGSGSDWPLSRKYGCTVEDAVELLVAAGRLGLDPAGVSFHVGSQQRNPHAWAAPIGSAARVFAGARAAGLHPWLLDLGG